MSTRLFVTLQRAEARLLSLDTVESLQAHIQTGTASPEDREMAARAVEDHQRLDGSWHGSVVRTAEALMMLGELRGGRRTNAVDRGIEWMHDRCNRPGRFAGSCDPDAHPLGLCHHFVSGFFAVAPSSVSLHALSLQDGSTPGSDRDARIAVSALAAAALFRFGDDGSQLRLQLDALSRIIRHAVSGRYEISHVTFVCITRCLLVAPEDASAVIRDQALDHLAHAQRADGSWPGVDLFTVLDVLADAAARGQAPMSVRTALENSTQMLYVMQQDEGGWGRDAGAFQLLAGWRALRQLAAWRRTAGPQAAGRLNSAVSPPHGQ